MKHLKRLIILVVVAVVGLITFGITTYKVQPNEVALVIRLGKIESTVSEPGLHFKAPFIESVSRVYIGDVLYDIPASDVITSDKKSMIADDYVIWSVVDPVKYYQSLGAISQRAEERIEAAVYNATKNTISSMVQDDIIAARGSVLTNLITTASNSDIAQYGVTIKLAEIKALDLPDANRIAVFERMKSERQNIAAGYRAEGNAEAKVIRNEADKQIKIIAANAEKEAATLDAEGEAEYMKILSDAYNDESKAEFYTFIRGLDSLKALAGDNKTLILDKDSEYAQLLYGLK